MFNYTQNSTRLFDIVQNKRILQIKKGTLTMKTRKILIMRHAQSEEDIDPTIYNHTHDLDVGLSDQGKTESEQIASPLAKEISTGNVHFFLSPGTRLLETYQLLSARLPKRIKCTESVEPLILKQYWGPLTSSNRRNIEIERYKAGVLRYRFPAGESGAQLLTRFRFFCTLRKEEIKQDQLPGTIVFLTHGFEMRLLLMLWFDWTEVQFEKMANPYNCEYARIAVHSNGTYTLQSKMRTYDPSQNPKHIKRELD